MSMRVSIFLAIFVSSTLFSSLPLHSLTLEETIQRALNVSYVVKEQNEQVRALGFSYISTIDPYLPRVDINSSYTRYLGRPQYRQDPSTNAYIRGSKQTYTLIGTASYLLFDGGARYAKRKEALYAVEREKERLKTSRVDVAYTAKSAFYNVLGKQLVVERRKEAYEITKRIFDLTNARYEEGLVLKSEKLQSEVRLSTARVELFNAKGEYEKAMEDLLSIIFWENDKDPVMMGTLEEPSQSFSKERLIERASSKRPDLKSQINEIERLRMVYKERRSEWFPKIEVELYQTRQDKDFFPENRDNYFGVNFSYPLFDGVGRYYNMKAASSDIEGATYRLKELRRTVGLEVVKALKDYEINVENVKSYKALLREATANFEQAYGEYMVGKGNILTLLQSERDLAKAKEDLVVSLYLANLSLANLEKVAYLDENLQ